MPAAVASILAREHVSAERRDRDAEAREQSSVHSAAPGGCAEACEFRFVSDRAGFDSLEADWNALFERAGRGAQLFQTFNWLWHWCNHYLSAAAADEGGRRLAILTARRGGRLVAVWPLVSERAGGLRRLAWMGEPVSQYGDVLVDALDDAPSILSAGWQFICAHSDADLIQLRKVRADCALASLLSRSGAIVTERLAAPYLDLASAPSFAKYEKRYSSNTRRNRKRQRRRLEERGVIVVEAPTAGARAAELAQVALDLKRVWLKDRGLVSQAFADDRISHFFSDAAASTERPVGCHVLAMTCGDVPAALEIGLRCKDRAAIHVIVYDRAFEKMAAGALLMEESVRRASEAGLSTFDLLAPADAYKTDWADGSVEVSDWAVPLTVAGRVYARVYLLFFRALVKKALAVLPPSLRRAVAQGYRSLNRA